MFADEDVRERDGRWDAETWDASQFDRGIQLSEPRANGDQRPGGEASEAEGRAAKVGRPSLRERAVVIDRGRGGLNEGGGGGGGSGRANEASQRDRYNRSATAARIWQRHERIERCRKTRAREMI